MMRFECWSCRIGRRCGCGPSRLSPHLSVPRTGSTGSGVCIKPAHSISCVQLRSMIGLACRSASYRYWITGFDQCCGAGAGRSRGFELEPEPFLNFNWSRIRYFESAPAPFLASEKRNDFKIYIFNCIRYGTCFCITNTTCWPFKQLSTYKTK